MEGQGGEGLHGKGKGKGVEVEEKVAQKKPKEIDWRDRSASPDINGYVI